jgi:tRNA (cytidine/uridine-2'-O-)-methyltransferase
MLHVCLVEPEIPPNTGNVARLCAATFTGLHIVGATGFRMDDRTLKRAGLDYWTEVNLHRHLDLERLYAALPASRFLYFTTKTKQILHRLAVRAERLFNLRARNARVARRLARSEPERCLTIPMPNPKVRSLNLATSVGIVLYEALRQTGFQPRQPDFS